MKRWATSRPFWACSTPRGLSSLPTRAAPLWGSCRSRASGPPRRCGLLTEAEVRVNPREPRQHLAAPRSADGRLRYTVDALGSEHDRRCDQVPGGRSTAHQSGPASQPRSTLVAGTGQPGSRIGVSTPAVRRPLDDDEPDHRQQTFPVRLSGVGARWTSSSCATRSSGTTSASSRAFSTSATSGSVTSSRRRSQMGCSGPNRG